MTNPGIDAISFYVPQLYVSNLMELTKKQKSEIEKNIKAGIKRLKSFQL